MRITGVIAEYDPFHRGHAYQLERARAVSGCDYVVVCMSGNVTQRGEIAFQEKAARARMALLGGADAVFDLPALFVPRPAEVFARGGVGVLGGLNVDVLSFGCETTDVKLLNEIAALTADEPPELTKAIREKLSRGMPHARARGDAVAEQLGVDPMLLRSPNALLASCYLRALREGGFDMEILPVKRLGSHGGGGEGFASGSEIRAGLRAGDAAMLDALPESSRALFDAGDVPLDESLPLLYRLRSMAEAELARVADVSEGLECRILRAARESGSREALLEAVKCRRYTRARLSRILICALLGIDRELCESRPRPGYARLLACREDAGPLLKELKARATIPLVADATALKGDPVFETECRATDLRALLNRDAGRRATGGELKRKFLRV